MQLQSCSSVTDEEIFAPVGLRLTSDSSRLYITNNKAGSDSAGYPFQSGVIFCDVNKNGSINLPCQEVLGSAFDAPGSTWIAGDYAYVINNDFIATVSICPIQTDNTFANCKPYQYTDSSVGVDIIVNEQAAKAYIAHASAPDNKIYICDINITAGALSNCNAFTDSNFTYFESAGLQLSPDNQWLYVTNNYDSGNSITVCGINADGSLSSPCKLATDASAGLNIPAGRIAFKLIGNTYYAYIANRGGVTITYCTYDPTTGTLGLDGGCNFSGYVTNGTSIAIQGNYLYAAQVYDLSYIFTIAICPIQNDGSLGLCQLSDGEGKITQGFYTANFLVQNNIAYVPNNKAQNIVFCGTSGNTLTNCSTLIQPLPNGRMTFANFNGTNYVYFANNIATFNSPFSAGSIYKCAVQANGMFTGCQELVLGFGANFYFGGFDLNAAQNLLYATGAYTNPTGNFPAAIFALDSIGDITATEIFTRPGSLFDKGYLSNILMSNPNNMAYFPLNVTLPPLFVAFCSQDDLDGCVYYIPPPPPYFIEPMSVWTQRFAL